MGYSKEFSLAWTKGTLPVSLSENHLEQKVARASLAVLQKQTDGRKLPIWHRQA